MKCALPGPQRTLLLYLLYEMQWSIVGLKVGRLALPHGLWLCLSEPQRNVSNLLQNSHLTSWFVETLPTPSAVIPAKQLLSDGIFVIEIRKSSRRPQLPTGARNAAHLQLATSRHRPRDHSIRYMPFPIGGPLEPSLYLKPFSRYSVPTYVNEQTNKHIHSPTNTTNRNTSWRR